MSEMTVYFQSLERAAELAISVNETLQAHPHAVVRYKDEEFNEELMSALDDLEAAIIDPESQLSLGDDEEKESSLDLLFPRESVQESDYF